MIVTATDIERCDGCDAVQTIEDHGYEIELHHVIPDDGAPHSPTLDCGCGVRLEWLEHDLAVVEHPDQDIDLDLGE
jgi:hypothetical protein